MYFQICCKYNTAIASVLERSFENKLCFHNGNLLKSQIFKVQLLKKIQVSFVLCPKNSFPVFSFNLYTYQALVLDIGFFILFFNVYYFCKRERETESQKGRGRERGRRRIQSRLQALSCQQSPTQSSNSETKRS